MQPQNGAKRPRDDSHDKPLEFICGLRLSQHPPEQQKDLFLKKLKDVAKTKSLHPTEFEGYTIRERFAKVGWEQLLDFNCEKIYRRVVIQWTSSLSKNGDELTGIVNGKPYTITPAVIRDLLGVDTRTDMSYARLSKADFRITTDEKKIRWLEACKTVFGTYEDAKAKNGWYLRSKMTPLVKVLWLIGASTFNPRAENMNFVRAREIYLLHALSTGEYLYSFAHVMINNIWNMYEFADQQTIPHGHYISEILDRLGAVSNDEYIQVVPPQYRLISRESIYGIRFSESPVEYIIDDCENFQRVTFSKKVIQGEGPSEPLHKFPQPPFQMPPQIYEPESLLGMSTNLHNLINQQSYQFQKQHNELMTRVSSVHMHMVLQVLEAKSMVSNMQKQMELQALESKTMVSNIQKQMESQALETERREQEIERRAEVRAHAIICEIKRQHSIHQQEELNQLHISLNQGNNVNEVNETQFPQMSYTSSRLPHVVSKYYDPARGDEIPKEFQSLYGDIFGQDVSSPQVLPIPHDP
ncbi:hypothetical protein Tco_0531047 [Tanacetum coccineum]